MNEYVVLQDRWSLMAVVSQDRFRCIFEPISKGQLCGDMFIVNGVDFLDRFCPVNHVNVSATRFDFSQHVLYSIKICLERL